MFGIKEVSYAKKSISKESKLGKDIQVKSDWTMDIPKMLQKPPPQKEEEESSLLSDIELVKPQK